MPPFRWVVAAFQCYELRSWPTGRCITLYRISSPPPEISTTQRASFPPWDERPCLVRKGRRIVVMYATTCGHHFNLETRGQQESCIKFNPCTKTGWIGSRVVSVLESGAVGPGFKSQSRRFRVTVVGKLFTPIVLLFTKQYRWWQPS